MKRLLLPTVSTLASIAVFTLAAPAAADTSVIKRPGAHPDYVFEAEPHLALGFFGGPGHGGDDGFGPGFRGTIELVDNGFIKTINNTVGIGFGMDWVFYDDHCHGGPRRARDCHDHDRIIFPVVMQWNFWLSQNWSVFGEPGFAFHHVDDHGDDDFDIDPFVFYAGGRFHFNDKISLTMRVGWPTFSVGASFFL